ncbi:Subtilase family protein [Amycolatopsis xylanica]|uniref:Subtilase family protein n=1 Tax=Amycolatopsis xylanica TaxID=589385 RepID=A0A1H3K591_9PSEU|nr:S8 family serine peptidase [Amycolatopsis xylanica]SDY46768.1 Subtilase family protein [Amycolatopsis xylanica]
MKPAWSWQFDRPSAAPATRLPGEITRDWAWGSSTGAGVKVAVVDSGIDTTAVGPIAGGVAVEVVDGKPVLLDGDHEDLFGHGTACAGIIRRAAPEAALYSVRVLSTTLSGTGVALLAGLRWALDHGIGVINLSLSTKRREHFAALHEIADRAYFRNTVLIAAVNNVPAVSYPAEFASVFSVAACEGTGPFVLRYNPSPPVEFGAPGIAVEVPWAGGGTVTATGNSFAAAHVTGLVARVLGKHPGMTPFQLKTILHAVAD